MLALNECAYLFFQIPQFNVYETKHFTFYCIPNSSVEKDIKKISHNSELAVNWFENYMNMVIDLKIDTYLFDSKKNSVYQSYLNNIDIELTAANIRGVIHFYYDFVNYNAEKAGSIILHEACHLIQFIKLYLYNAGIYEGHAHLIESLYFINKTENNLITEKAFLEYLKIHHFSKININDFLPHKLFSLSYNEFQKFENPGDQKKITLQYEISASFIALLIDQYGIEKLKSWFYYTNKDNFKSTFKKNYTISFQNFEKIWLNKILN